MLASGEFPREWVFDPKQIRYLEGCGLSRERGVSLISAMVAVGGRGSLCLGDKPELASLFLARAQNADP